MSVSTSIQGDIDVFELIIRSLSGDSEYDLSNQIVSFDIYESLEAHTITAEVTIDDPFDLLTTFPFVGEEEITIEFQTPGAENVSRYVFFVHDIVNMLITDTGNSRRYTFRCVTKEFLLNMTRLYSRRYVDSYDHVIQSILRNQLHTDKTVNIEPTRGDFDMMISNKRPFQVIDLATRRATSQRHQSSLFVFFEDKNGYNFTTIENLFAQRTPNIGDKQFFYDLGNQASAEAINMRQVLAFRSPVIGNNMNKLLGAGINSVTRSFDLLTGKIQEYDYNNSRDTGGVERGDPDSLDFNTEEFNTTFGSNAQKFFVVNDMSRQENFYDANLGFKHAYMQKLTQYMVTMQIYGDNELTVGDVITLTMPEISSTTENKSVSNLLNENYMIHELRHMITRDETGFGHMISCKLVKGNFTTRI